jgi:serine protease Do
MNPSSRKRMGAAFLFVLALAAGAWLGTVVGSAPRPLAQSPVPNPATGSEARFVQATGEFYSDDSPIIRVVEKVKNAVVNIEAVTEGDRNGPSERGWFPFFHPPTGRSQSFGSGFFIRPDGTILTNHHVVSGADRITVRLSDEHEYTAELLGADRETDLAVVRIVTADPVPFIELGDSDNLRIGQWVVAIGNPFPRQRLDRTVTVGVVSGVGRSELNFGRETPTYQNYIQTDAAINPGNSGGPLVNLQGQAVGVNAAIASPSGGNVGIGFAIPVTYVKAVLDDLMDRGRVSRGWLGIRPRELTPDLAEALELDTRHGVVVEEVLRDTPAQRYGLKQGDVIIRFNGEQVNDVQQFMFLVARARPNTEVGMDVIRDGETRTLAVWLAERDEEALAAAPRSTDESPDSWFGMRVRTATPSLAERYAVAFEPGVIVTEVEPDSPADDKRIARGNIITTIQREPVASVEDFRRIRARLADRDRPVLFLVVDNNGNPRFAALKSR